MTVPGVRVREDSVVRMARVAFALLLLVGLTGAGTLALVWQRTSPVTAGFTVLLMAGLGVLTLVCATIFVATARRTVRALGEPWDAAVESHTLEMAQQEAARLRRSAHGAARLVREELDRESILVVAAAALGDMALVDRVWIRSSRAPEGSVPEAPIAVDV